METTVADPETAATDLEDDLEQDQAPAPEGSLFDPEQYETDELRLPKIDGEGVDKIHARFTGRAWLDRADPRDVHLIRDLRLGQTVTLLVEAVVGPPVPGYTTTRDGDLDSLTLGRTFRVEKVWRASVETTSELLEGSA